MGMAELVTHLRTLPEDWGSWLVYADALSERGDPRGELLVRAHRLQTTALADTGMRAELERLEDHWMRSWGEVHAEDIAGYDRCRRMAPLGEGAPTPSDLLPILGRPISHLLALLDPDE